MATLHLLMGLPGSGKTSLGKRLSAETGAIHVSSDIFRLILFPMPKFSQTEHDTLYKVLDQTVGTLLEAGYDVVYDANLNRHRHREEKYVLAKSIKAQTVLWWLTTPSDIAKDRRIKDQNHILIPEGDTPEKLFERVASVMEEPDVNEPHLRVNGTSIDKLDLKKIIISDFNHSPKNRN